MARPVRLSVWTALAVLAVGCGGRGDPERYVPRPADAQAALAAALDAWKAGQPPGRLTTAGAPVQVVDSHRRPGQRLKDYAVLGEVPGDARRCFAVRLTLEEPSEERQTRYVVIGIDPVWVFSHDDYQMMIHWECAPSEEGTSRPAPPK